MLKAAAFAMAMTIAPLPDTSFEMAVKNGLHYLQGIGVERDHPRALAWFYIARTRNTAVNVYIRMVEPYLSPVQIARAHAIADRCLAAKLTHCELLTAE